MGCRAQMPCPVSFIVKIKPLPILYHVVYAMLGLNAAVIIEGKK